MKYRANGVVLVAMLVMVIRKAWAGAMKGITSTPLAMGAHPEIPACVWGTAPVVSAVTAIVNPGSTILDVLLVIVSTALPDHDGGNSVIVAPAAIPDAPGNDIETARSLPSPMTLTPAIPACPQ